MESGSPGRELERAWLHILAFLSAAWLVIGGAGAGITLALTYSAWAFAWFIPCAVVTLTWLGQLAHLMKSTRKEQQQ